MASLGSLRVELELDDGTFTTRVVRAGNALRLLKDNVEGNIVAIRRLDTVTSDIAGALGRLTLGLAIVRSAVMNAYAIFGQWGVSILQTAGNIERLNTLLGSLSTEIGSVARAADAARSTQFLIDLSRNAPYRLNDLTEAFVRLRTGGIQNTEAATRSLVDAVAAFGGSSQQLDRASVAIQQMAGKGVLSMEELRQQLGEAVPSALPLLARALSMTMDDLVKAISDGKVRAEPALRALFGEFERTFGGRAIVQMQTFNGQVQQLQNTWQQLQVATAGAPGSGGFLDSATDVVKKLNEALSSPDARSFGIAIGQSLSNITNALVRGVQVAYEYRDAITTAAQAFTVLAGVMITRAVFSFVVTQVSLAIVQLNTFATAINTASSATAANGLLNLTATFRNLTQAIITSAAAVGTFLFATGSGTLFSMLSTAISAGASAFMFLTNAIAAASRALTAFLLASNGISRLQMLANVATMAMNAMAPAFDALAARMAATGTAAAALSLTLRALFIGSVIVGGIYLIATAVSYLSGLYQRLTRDAGAAYDRIRQGATDESTLKTARDEADALTQSVATARDQLRQLEAVRRGERRSVAVPGVSGQGVLNDVAGVRLLRQNNAELERSIEERRQFIQRGEERINQTRDMIVQAGFQRIEQIAAQASAREMAQILRDSQDRRAAYDREIGDIQKAREQIATALSNGEITTDMSDMLLRQLNEEKVSTQLRNYRQQIEEFNTAIAAAERRRDAATNPEAREAAIRTLRDLRQAAEQTTQAMEGLTAETENLMTSGASATGAQQAQTALNNLRTRAAELNAESVSLGGNLARINQIIANGQWGNLRESLTQQLIEAARAADEAEQKIRTFREAQSALSRIDTGLRRAQSELEGYQLTISNPDLSNAQRAFIQFQNEMQAALAAVARQTGGVGDEYAAAAEKVRQAINAARQSTALSELERYIEGGRQAAAQAADRGPRRAAIQREMADAEYARRRQQVSEANSPDQARLLAAVETSYRARLAAIDADSRRAGAGAAQREANLLTELRQKIAELRGEQEDGTGAVERYTQRLQDAGQIGTAYGNQVLALARQLDEQRAAAERAQRAIQALRAIQDGTRSSTARGNEYFNMLANPNLSTGNREFVRFQAETQARLQLIREEGNATRIASAEQEAQNAARARARELLGQMAIAQRDEVVQIRESLATSTSDRLAAANRAIDIERTRAQSLITQAQLTADQQRVVEDQLQNYIQARREQAARQNENAAQRMLREWSNTTDNMSTAFASAMDKFTDELAKFVTTGKADFSSLAQSIIQDIIKIQIRAAISTVFGGGQSGGAGGAANGFLGGLFGGNGGDFSFGKLISGLFGGFSGGVKSHSGSIVGFGGTPMNILNYMLAGAQRYHTGGMLGADEVPIIAQRGEGVFTSDQLAAIGRMNHSYTLVERVMQQMAGAMAVPSAATPSTGGAVNSSYGSGANVTVNMINQSNQGLSAEASQPRIDGEQIIIDVVIKNMSRPGPMRDSVKAAMN